MSKLVRLKPFNPKRGFTLRTYTVSGTRFTQGAGWYRVSDDLAEYLRTVPSNDADPDSPYAFQVCTAEEAAAIDEAEREQALASVQRNAAPIDVDGPRRVHTPKSKRAAPEGVLTTADLPRAETPAALKMPEPPSAELEDADEDDDFDRAYEDGDDDAQIEALRMPNQPATTKKPGGKGGAR